MSSTVFDASGTVNMAGYGRPAGFASYIAWADLDAFTQGYIEAMFLSFGHTRCGFRHLSPEALARVIADCEAWRGQFYGRTHSLSKDRPDMGREFWRIRQEGKRSTFPPLTVQLGDDGKVRFA